MAKAPDIAANPELLRLTREVKALRQEIKSLTRRLAEAERLADHDVLTPLLNRRAFLREVQRAIALIRRHDTPASVIYFDLDGFKQINDRFGHAAGDACLVAVAERLLAEVRQTDVVGRIGGDEFVVLLQHADTQAAVAKATLLAEAVSGALIACEGEEIVVRLSWGVREIGGIDSAEQAVAEADAAMYLRKPRRA